MHIIAVDDERLALKNIERAIRTAEPDCDLHCFDRPSFAVAHAGKNNIDVAFLDIKMCDMDGLQLAKWLKDISPETNIIFFTAYNEYARDSYDIPASDYLIKPVTPEAVKDALQKLRNPISKPDTRLPALKKLRAHCFGNFDVYMGTSAPLYFPRSKAKELLAYLIHRRGASCTVEELATVLFDGKEFNSSTSRQVQTIISTMRKTLSMAGAEHALIKQYNSIAIDPENIDCDYYRFLNRDEEAIDIYRITGEYMYNYHWAELTSGRLLTGYGK